MCVSDLLELPQHDIAGSLDQQLLRSLWSQSRLVCQAAVAILPVQDDSRWV